MTTPDRYQAQNKVRFVTAASLFDGHDAAINIMRRILIAGARGGGDSSGSQPFRRRRSWSPRVQEDARWHRGVVLPGRPQRVLPVHEGPAGPTERAPWVRIKVYGGGGGVIIPRGGRGAP